MVKIKHKQRVHGGGGVSVLGGGKSEHSHRRHGVAELDGVSRCCIGLSRYCVQSLQQRSTHTHARRHTSSRNSRAAGSDGDNDVHEDRTRLYDETAKNIIYYYCYTIYVIYTRVLLIYTDIYRC